jgi:tetratricopeptide (TPR) repeat protein
MTDLLVHLQAALVERYAIERELGQGGMAVVFLAQDLKHRRAVAIKVLRPELAMALGADRFLGEIETVAGLTHPHIVPLYDSGEAAGFLFFVMPYIDGESLRQRLTREKQLPLEDAMRIAGDVATALSYAHSRGVVHRDIKPENILLQAGQAVVSDFGIARAIAAAGGERLTQTGVTIGTPGYMSPEQAAGERELDGRSDVYSLACVLYEMLAGNPPFLGASARAILARQSLDPVPRLRTVRETVPAEFEQAVVKALAKAPADRFATATQFVEALATGSSAPRSSRRALLTRVALPLVVALTVIGAVVLARRVSLGRNLAALDPNVVAVAPFDVLDPNLTRWREGLVDVLSANLDGAGPLRTVSPTMVIHNWSGRGDQASAATLGRRTGARLVILGTVIGAGGDSARVTARWLDVATGKVLGEVIEIRDMTSRMDRLTDSITVGLLRELNRTRPIGAFQHASLGARSLPALNTFLRGEQFFRRAAWDSALAHYQRAVTLDSGFTIAWSRMSSVQGCWKRGGLGDPFGYKYGLLAGSLNRGLPPRESLLVAADSLYQALLDGPTDPGGREHHTRLFTTLDEAVRRYPNDPEAWYELGEARMHWPLVGRTTPEQILEAFDRAIALDSAFGPAYIHPVQVALRLGRPAAARRYLAAYLALDEADLNSEGMGLVEQLLVRPQPSPAKMQRQIDAASGDALIAAWNVMLHLPDSAETDVRLARALVSSRHTGAPVDDPLVREWVLTNSLAHRGHLREAYAVGGTHSPAEFAQLALLGGVPPESARATFAGWLAEPLPRQFSFDLLAPRLTALPWWAARGDTSSLQASVRRWRAIASGAGPNVELRLWALYGAASGQAYVALAHHDTADALRRFDGLPDSVCPCLLDRVVAAQLLQAHGRPAEAAAVLESSWPIDWLDPAEGLWRLERARVAERLGQHDKAVREYQYLADLWRTADPELRREVEEANSALKRLAVGSPR